LIRAFSRYGICVLALACAACSKRERSDPNAEEWADIQAIAGEPVGEPESRPVEANTNAAAPVVNLREVPVGEFDAFVQRLEQMKSIERKEGETLLTGEALIFDQKRRLVRLDEDVTVVDDQGTLKAQRLTGRFSISNRVELIEADGGVDLVSGNRHASADEAVYNVQSGFVRMMGQAEASDGGNRLSGERIELWIKGSRRMVCEPNALLEIKGGAGFSVAELADGADGDMEIRADQVAYDESRGLAELRGNVRLRDPRVAMNCENVRIYLKDRNEIDWIDAVGGVIIQTKERKALAERATYHGDEGKFTLLGEPKVMQGLNVMTGEKIVFWHATRRMICEPNARVLLYLDEDTKAKFLNDLNE